MSEENYKINIKSYEVIPEILGVPAAVHHEIVFIQPDGKEYALNGQAWNVDENRPQPKVTSLLGDTTLRVDINDDGGMWMKEAAESTSWEGSKEDWTEKLAIAVEVAVHLNDQNLEYDIVRVLSESQNSNSVASTVLAAMGLNYPPEIKALFAPGSDRIMLPREPLQLQGGNFNGAPIYLDDVENSIASLSKGAISEQITNDKNIGKETTETYDPNNVVPSEAAQSSLGEFTQNDIFVDNNGTTNDDDGIQPSTKLMGAAAAAQLLNHGGDGADASASGSLEMIRALAENGVIRSEEVNPTPTPTDVTPDLATKSPLTDMGMG